MAMLAASRRAPKNLFAKQGHKALHTSNAGMLMSSTGKLEIWSILSMRIFYRGLKPNNHLGVDYESSNKRQLAIQPYSHTAIQP
jgi:hypothetical protein